MKTVVVSSSFDDLRSHHIRLLQEAARLGAVHALLWSDERVMAAHGRAPTFPLAERHYVLQAIRYVTQVTVIDPPYDANALPPVPDRRVDVWAMPEDEVTPGRRAFCAAQGIACHAFTAADLAGYPEMRSPGEDYQRLDPICLDSVGFPPSAIRRRPSVVVTGCYDWFHSGHIRFFEEVSELGDLYVVVGHDENVRLLKGEGHPLFPAEERRYMVGSARYVSQALISSGHGWMDAEPEIERLKPDMYAVNEDGDKPEKRRFCEEHGLRYVVLKRTPKEGLRPRSSTVLRGF